MRYVSKNILSRVICFAFGMSLGIYQIAQGFFTGHIGVLFFGIGMVLLGVVWFLQPFVFDSIPGGVACAQGSPYRTSIRRIGSALGWTYSSIRVWCVIGGYLPAAEKILI